jgi:hypothetical protein
MRPLASVCKNSRHLAVQFQSSFSLGHEARLCGPETSLVISTTTVRLPSSSLWFLATALGLANCGCGDSHIWPLSHRWIPLIGYVKQGAPAVPAADTRLDLAGLAPIYVSCMDAFQNVIYISPSPLRLSSPPFQCFCFWTCFRLRFATRPGWEHIGCTEDSRGACH